MRWRRDEALSYGDNALLEAAKSLRWRAGGVKLTIEGELGRDGVTSLVVDFLLTARPSSGPRPLTAT